MYVCVSTSLGPEVGMLISFQILFIVCMYIEWVMLKLSSTLPLLFQKTILVTEILKSCLSYVYEENCL